MIDHENVILWFVIIFLGVIGGVCVWSILTGQSPRAESPLATKEDIHELKIMLLSQNMEQVCFTMRDHHIIQKVTTWTPDGHSWEYNCTNGVLIEHRE